MAFIVEDGTGVANANAGCTRQFVTDYLTERNRETENTWSSRTQAVQEAGIIAATDYVENRFGDKFNGQIEFPDLPQTLSFPRLNLRDSFTRLEVLGMPLQYKQAIAEYAVRAIASQLFQDPTYSAQGGAVVEQEDVVGPIKTRTRYAEGTTSTVIVRAYPAADQLLRRFLRSTGGVIR